MLCLSFSVSCMLELFLLGKQDAVEAVISILGMSACDGTDAVPPNARSHTVLLSGKPLLFHVECPVSSICWQSCCWQLECRLLLFSSNTEQEGTWPVSQPALLPQTCVQLRW